MSAPLRFVGRERYEARGQIAKISRIRDEQFKIVGFVEEVLLEVLLQRGQVGVDFPKARLRVIVKIGTRANKLLVCFLEQPLLLACQVEFFALFVNGEYAIEQFLVEEDVVLVRREFRCDGLGRVFDNVVGMCAINRVKYS